MTVEITGVAVAGTVAGTVPGNRRVQMTAGDKDLEGGEGKGMGTLRMKVITVVKAEVIPEVTAEVFVTVEMPVVGAQKITGVLLV